ncbi:hypothetical protein DY000_02058745 [Brassica cretica]|uniref:Uncharacterized protein n=1 Tax=Brassica cretica TaxID=69181 RepID=A0ABQ7B3X0_BRACR|nr:hypothetical protein DY000_02058745 [Brassica cretica]
MELSTSKSHSSSFSCFTTCQKSSSMMAFTWCFAFSTNASLAKASCLFTVSPVVGVKNVYGEVNIQNVRRRKQKTSFDKYFFEIDSSIRKALRRKHETSDKSSKRGRYAATERVFRLIAT